MPEHEVKNIGGIIEDLMEKYGLDKHIQESKLISGWEDLVGEKLAKHCRPKYIKDGVLYVETKNTVWRQELAMKQQEWLNLFVKKLTKCHIREIKFI